MSEEGAKPENRSRRITVMGRRRSRATGDMGETQDEAAEGGDEASDPETASTQQMAAVRPPEESATSEGESQDTAEEPDETDKTNPRARADEIAAALSRLTPEPDDVRTNPRIVMEAIAGIARPSEEGKPRPAVVIAQAQIISDAPRIRPDEFEDLSNTVPIAPVLRTGRSQPSPATVTTGQPGQVRPSRPPLGPRPSLLNAIGPAVAAFEAEHAAKSTPPPALPPAPPPAPPDEDSVAVTRTASPIPSAPVAQDRAVDLAELELEAIKPATPSEPAVPWVDIEAEALETDALETDPGLVPTPLLVDEEGGEDARRANTPPPPPSDIAGRQSQVTGGAPRKPPPPPAAAAASSAAGSAVKPAPVEDDKKRKRVRQWWERFFSDDYLLTVPAPSAEQISKQVDFIEVSLGLSKGAMILDVGCGLGLHSIELCKRGYLVVGLDLSLAMITRAAESAQQQGLKLNFLHADIREIEFDGAFDAVICMGTTFGFFDDDANRDVLTRLYQALRPGGRILLDCVNRDYVVRWQPNLVWFEGDGCVCMEESDFNYFNSRLVVKRTVMKEDGQQSNSEYSLRAYSLHELGLLTQALGFRVIEVSGQEATRGVYFGNCSTRILMLAERRVATRASVVMPPERVTGEVPRPPVTGEQPKPPPK